VAPIASCEARYGGVVDIADSHQFGAYTDRFGIGPFCFTRKDGEGKIGELRANFLKNNNQHFVASNRL